MQCVHDINGIHSVSKKLVVSTMCPQNWWIFLLWHLSIRDEIEQIKQELTRIRKNWEDLKRFEKICDLYIIFLNLFSQESFNQYSNF